MRKFELVFMVRIEVDFGEPGSEFLQMTIETANSFPVPNVGDRLFMFGEGEDHLIDEKIICLPDGRIELKIKEEICQKEAEFLISMKGKNFRGLHVKEVTYT